MRGVLLVIVLSLNVTFILGDPKPNTKVSNPPQSHGSHNLLKTEYSKNSVNRPVRCTPCGNDAIDKKPTSNHLNPEYRGNGADNLGYDWSPMAWGGLAFPHRSKMFMGGMRGRDGRMMPGDWNGNQGSVHIICDTCRTYWEGDSGGGRGDSSKGRENDRGRQYSFPNNQNIYGGQQGNWQGGRPNAPQDFETRVSSPAVGVLVKPGSSIAYVPSRSGEMYWDGVSGGGTRWDGFSNGISWVGKGGSEWDRMDTNSREENLAPTRPGEYPYNTNSFRPWDQKGGAAWNGNNGRGYYFADGSPNQLNPQWADRGYASNWDYGSTNQFGWNGNNMKWNYGGKQWVDNDRAANQYYFNSPQDRSYGPGGGNQLQYGYQYPNYQPSANFRPGPAWRPDGGYRVNDRDPSNFPSGNYGSDKDRPWDYNSRNPSGFRRPASRPEWSRPGPYPSPGDYDKGNPGSYGSDKYPAHDKVDYDKPWNGPGYGPSKPNRGGSYPYGGNRYPEEGGRPGFSSSGNNLFYPNDGNEQPTYPNIGPSSGGNVRPTYPSSGNRPGGNYLGDNARPSTGYSGDRPGIIYTGGRPPMGGGTYSNPETTTGFPSAGSTTGGYANAATRPSGYPFGGSSPVEHPASGNRPSPDSYTSGRPLTGYPGDNSSPGGYPGGSSGSTSGYPSGGRPSSGYPGGGQPSGGYPSGGQPSGGYPSGGRPSGGYPSGGQPSGGYPSGGQPSGGYPSGGPSIGERPGGYPNGNRPSGGYPSGGGVPGGYPSSGGPSGGYPVSGGSSPGSYPGGLPSYPSGINRPGEYPSGGGSRPGGYPSYPSFAGSGGSSYPRPDGYPGAGYPIGSNRPFSGNGGFGYPGRYPSGSDGYFSGGNRPTGYPDDGRRPDEYPSAGVRPLYPVRGQEGNSGPPPGGLYYQGGKNPPKGYYMGYITEIGNGDRYATYGNRYPNYFGGSYPGDKSSYPEKDKNRYPYGGSSSNRYPSDDKDKYPSYPDDRYSSGGGSGGGGGGGGGSYPVVDRDRYPGYDRGSDRYYYGQNNDRGKYPAGYPSNQRYPNGGSGGDFEGSSSSDGDKNWNYGQNDRKDGSIYRRSGGSYPPYRGGQYFTSSYLASMSTTSGSTQEGSETKTQSITKADEVTQPTPS